MRLDWLFPSPKGCAFCSRPAVTQEKVSLCVECNEEIGWIGVSHCEQCGRHMDSPDDKPTTELRCLDCERQPGDIPLVNRAVVQYTPLAREVIGLFKYRGRETLATALGVMMAIVVRRHYRDEAIGAITYVPLHSKREEERGFNQAALLADVVGKELRLPVNGLLHRVIDTPKQSKQSRQHRLKGLDGVFKSKRNFYRRETLLIVDDIYTTGTTLRACSRELLSAGCSRVLAVTFAR